MKRFPGLFSIIAEPKAALPLKDCANCEYKRNNPDGGFCYMFETEPASTQCPQFKEARK